MKSKSGLPKDNARCFINVVVEGNEHTSRKLVASIECDEALETRTFQGDNAYKDAKKWIKDNL
jgi:hypothetical protein